MAYDRGKQKGAGTIAYGICRQDFPAGYADIKEIRDYILKDGIAIANKQAAVIYDALENLALFPNAGIDLNKYVSEHTDYKFIVIRKVYLAFYKINEKIIEVVRIFRGEQDYIRILGLNKL